ncbi:hypothetical protein ACFZBU_39415 [Embleya sp. NPDC008237]|uniref:hypothetical protein n=1 Tax=Embleya sp. NPDC008237 TaxID=3363978 RepID=UPI0036EBACA2
MTTMARVAELLRPGTDSRTPVAWDVRVGGAACEQARLPALGERVFEVSRAQKRPRS